MSISDYEVFLRQKAQNTTDSGFEPSNLPDHLYDFQRVLVEWAIRQGRGAIFADCGMGKTPMELAWAQSVYEHTGKPVLLLTPLAVGFQVVREGEKFGHEVEISRTGKPVAPITVTNYEQLSKFDPDDFGGVVADESSAIKSFEGTTRAVVTEFMRTHQYRLLGTATAAPNDYIELGTSSEALGALGHMDMLTRFFTNKNRSTSSRGRNSGGTQVEWNLKGHAEEPFWRWVSTWARAIRRPSDYGFSDERFNLPPLIETETLITPSTPSEEFLFDMPAKGLREERDENRRTINERCEAAAAKIEPHDISIAWCNLNDEGDLLEKLVPNAIQVSGSDSDSYKDAAAQWFVGDICICDDQNFRSKLAKWDGSRNTPRRDATSTGTIPLSDIVAKHKDAPQKKTPPTCVTTTAPTPKSSSDPLKRKRNETGNAASVTPKMKSTVAALKNSPYLAAQKSNETLDSLSSMGSRRSSMTNDSQTREASAQSVERYAAAVGDSQLTTTTRQEKSEGYSAETAIMDSVSSVTNPSSLNSPACICGHASGVRRLITKARIFGYGLNFQHCTHMTYFPSHSYEQYYQAVRRSWRFGQKSPVTVDLITSEGGHNVLKNLQRKASQADEMFDQLVTHMNHALDVDKHTYDTKIEVPSWLES